MIGAKISVSRDGAKLLYIYEFPEENTARTTYNVIKQNPQFLAQFEQYKAIIKGINFRLDGNKIIQTVEFTDEKSAECFYYIQKKIAEGLYGQGSKS